MSGFSLKNLGLQGLVLHLLALADGGVVAVVNERAARWIELTGLDFTGKVARGVELELLPGRELYQTVLTLIGVVILTRRDVDNTKGAERLDRNAWISALDQTAANLVEHMRQHGLDRGLADAAALDDIGGESGEELLGLHEMKN